MKQNRLSFLIQATLVLSGAILLAAPVALAAPDDAVSSTPSSEPTTTKLPEKLADRVTQYKTKQAVKLTAAEETKLKGACKAAQAKVTTLAASVDGKNTVREEIYGDVVKQLSTITARIKDADVDTKDLDAVNTELNKKIDQYKADATAFKTELADISEVDCVTDPTAFKAALLTARANRATLVTDATAIREYVPTITEKLKAAKDALAKEATTDTTTDTTEGGTE